VEVRIGVQMAPRELTVETDESADDIKRALTAALADGGVFVLTDDKGGSVIVPADKVAYLELGSQGPRRIGFST
jgi:mannose/fructose-specific phosphotransferase system component IIA